MTGVHPIVTYSFLTGDSVPEDPLKLLKGYSTDHILIHLSKLNALLYQLRSNENQDMDILGMVFFDRFGEDAPDLSRFEKLCANGLHLFAPQSVSMLVASSVENYKAENDPDCENAVVFMEELLLTILIFNELYFERFKGDDVNSLESVFQFDCMQQGYLRMHPVYSLITMVKFAFISNFMTVHEPLKAYSASYCKRMELQSPWYFGRFFRNIMEWSWSEVNKGKHILHSDHMQAKLFSEFSIEKNLSGNTRSFSVNMDVVPKPFYPIEHGAILLDYSFFHYPLERGFFWSFYKHELAGTSRFGKYNNFQSYLGTHYFERFLVGQLLRAIFCEKGQVIVSDDKYQDFIVKVSPKDIFIFEAKMVSANAKSLEDLDYQKFKEFLDSNFLASKKVDGKAKGVHQLLRQIDYLCQSDVELLEKLEIKSAKNLNIYPILICSDSAMNTSGVNAYLDAAFEPLLKGRRNSFQSIRPLTVMYVDLLMEYFALWKSKKGDLAKYIQRYHKNVRGLELLAQRGDMMPYILSKRSFANYIRSQRLAEEIASSINLMKKSLDLYF